MKFLLSGETPSKKNSRILLPNGKIIPGKKYMEWHELAYGELINQKTNYKAMFPLANELEITLVFYHGDKIRRDSDNGTSSVLDTLVDAGVIKDDNWQIIKAINVLNHYDKDNARCEIVIDDYKTM